MGFYIKKQQMSCRKNKKESIATNAMDSLIKKITKYYLVKC